MSLVPGHHPAAAALGRDSRFGNFVRRSIRHRKRVLPLDGQPRLPMPARASSCRPTSPGETAGMDLQRVHAGHRIRRQPVIPPSQEPRNSGCVGVGDPDDARDGCKSLWTHDGTSSSNRMTRPGKYEPSVTPQAGSAVTRRAGGHRDGRRSFVGNISFRAKRTIAANAAPKASACTAPVPVRKDEITEEGTIRPMRVLQSCPQTGRWCSHFDPGPINSTRPRGTQPGRRSGHPVSACVAT